MKMIKTEWKTYIPIPYSTFRSLFLKWWMLPVQLSARAIEVAIDCTKERQLEYYDFMIPPQMIMDACSIVDAFVYGAEL